MKYESKLIFKLSKIC